MGRENGVKLRGRGCVCREKGKRGNGKGGAYLQSSCRKTSSKKGTPARMP